MPRAAAIPAAQKPKKKRARDEDAEFGGRAANAFFVPSANLPFGTHVEQWAENSSLARNAPASIDYCTGLPQPVPANWSARPRAEAACKGLERHARLAGFIPFRIEGVEPETVKGLVKPRTFLDTSLGFNADGEYTTPHGQILLTQLMDILEEEDDVRVSEAIYSLQSPTSSQWQLPFIRCFSNHKYNAAKKSLEVKVYIYFTRTLFLLIADPSIRIIMDHMKGIPVTRVPVNPLPAQPVMFTKSAVNEAYSYTLPGLLKHAESTGYASARATFPRQPQALAVDLFDFQRSSYEWMQDQEADVDGINRHFWEELQYEDGGGFLYYFPLAGEFRMNKPPVATGGLLCEEVSPRNFLFFPSVAPTHPTPPHPTPPHPTHAHTRWGWARRSFASRLFWETPARRPLASMLRWRAQSSPSLAPQPHQDK